ncbi:unnamed protein product [Meganyctiphanes norvegica]|uniref:Uncharacterized protein n=1 Tax=Meganyctiphanes norvegica TaxID=48144 RepID=A0AAV2RUH7_MEGNR
MARAYTKRIAMVLCVVLCILNISLVIVVVTLPEDNIEDSIESAMGRYGLGDYTLDTSLDAAQQELNCCGVLNYTDWTNFNFLSSQVLHDLILYLACAKNMT